jgi:hypothetical protein
MILQEGVAPEHEWRQLKGDETLLSILRSKLWGRLGLSGAWHQKLYLPKPRSILDVGVYC